MADAVDYYAILGVAPTSDDVVIRAAYRALMLKYHPDTNADARSTLKAAQINEAYKVLSDTSERARYDELRNGPEGQSTDAAASQATPTWEGAETRTRVVSWIIIGIIALGVVASLGDQKVSPQAATKRTGPAIAASPPPMETASLPVTAPVATSTRDLPPDLQSPKTIAFADMEAAAVQFDRVLQRRGIWGAKFFSQGCHRGFVRRPSWTAADRCAAFDFAAAHIDSGMNTVSKGAIRQNDYFIFEDENQADNYAPFNASPDQINDRLARIRRAATLAVERVISDRLDSKSPTIVSQPVQNAQGAP
jgi:hypothetical protein